MRQAPGGRADHPLRPRRLSRSSPVTLLVLLPAPAGTRVVAPHLVVDHALLHGGGAGAGGRAAAPATRGHIGRRRIGQTTLVRRSELAGGHGGAGEGGLSDEVIAARVVEADQRLFEGDGRKHGEVLGAV